MVYNLLCEKAEFWLSKQIQQNFSQSSGSQICINYVIRIVTNLNYNNENYPMINHFVRVQLLLYKIFISERVGVSAHEQMNQDTGREIANEYNSILLLKIVSQLWKRWK